MRIAVTDHAVERFMERVEGAKGFYRESVRQQVRKIVADGFREGVVRPHPFEHGRRIIPFQSGDSVLYLSLAPNDTKFKADVAVIGVLFWSEVSPGQSGIKVTLGDLFPNIGEKIARVRPPQYIIRIGLEENSIEEYRLKDETALRELVLRRKPRYDEVALYRLIE